MYRLISVSGADAVDFLQGQLTQDLKRLPAAGRLPAAWCNPKGRVIVVITLLPAPDGVSMLVPATLADSVLQRLAMFRFRSKVEFAIADAAAEMIADGEADIAALIKAGRPFIDERNTEQFTPHMLNLDKLGAISFTKGCYTGQEIVARTENLGKSKRRLMRYRAENPGIKPGDKLSHDERPVGDVVNAAGADLLAVTPVDLHAETLIAESGPVSPRGLPYSL